MEEVIGSIPLGSTILPLHSDAEGAAYGARAPAPTGRAKRIAVGFALAVLTCATHHPARADGAMAFEVPAADPVVAADPPPAEAGIPALVASLRDRILSARSATLALEGWCAEQGLAADPHLVALRLPVVDKPLTAAQRARLAIEPDEPVRYRRVRLACGDCVLSEADNWYVPARLTPAMNAALDGTRTPFGRVVSPLQPVRRTVTVKTLPVPARPEPDQPLFEVDAVLSTGAGEPFCEVVETYLGGVVPGSSR